MKIIKKSALAAVATAGLIFATSATASAVTDHEHCLLTPDGYVVVAAGVSEVAPEDPALDKFHKYVHFGKPGEQLTIVRIPVGGECPEDPPEAAAEQD